MQLVQNAFLAIVLLLFMVKLFKLYTVVFFVFTWYTCENTKSRTSYSVDISLTELE